MRIIHALYPWLYRLLLLCIRLIQPPLKSRPGFAYTCYDLSVFPEFRCCCIFPSDVLHSVYTLDGVFSCDYEVCTPVKVNHEGQPCYETQYKSQDDLIHLIPSGLYGCPESSLEGSCLEWQPYRRLERVTGVEPALPAWKAVTRRRDTRVMVAGEGLEPSTSGL